MAGRVTNLRMEVTKRLQIQRENYKFILKYDTKN